MALIGGIGAGKSTVSSLLHDLGAAVLDADLTARAVVDPATPAGRSILARIAAEFGAGVLTVDGGLDRAAVAELVFGDDANRARYNAIIHPAIRDATRTAIDAARETNPDGVLVHEIPLLTVRSAPLPWTYDLVVAVEADASERIRRLVSGRGYTGDQAKARIAAQGDEQGRLAIADVVIRTDGTLDQTRRDVAELWASLADRA